MWFEESGSLWPLKPCSWFSTWQGVIETTVSGESDYKASMPKLLCNSITLEAAADSNRFWLGTLHEPVLWGKVECMENSLVLGFKFWGVPSTVPQSASKESGLPSCSPARRLCYHEGDLKHFFDDAVCFAIRISCQTMQQNDMQIHYLWAVPMQVWYCLLWQLYTFCCFFALLVSSPILTASTQYQSSRSKRNTEVISQAVYAFISCKCPLLASHLADEACWWMKRVSSDSSDEFKIQILNLGRSCPIPRDYGWGGGIRIGVPVSETILGGHCGSERPISSLFGYGK